MYFSTDYTSPIGKILIASDKDAIVGLWFYTQKYFKSTINDEIVQKDDLPIFGKVSSFLDDYFNGFNPKINFKLKPEGTEFRQKVWKILTDIPYGTTMTYGQIASKISPTMSAQAVGGAVGHNPISVLIPCHRVVGTDGSLTGYAGGTWRKSYLLKLERGGNIG